MKNDDENENQQPEAQQAPDAAMAKKGLEPPATGSSAGDRMEAADDPDREFDLNDPEECIQWMLSAWTCLPEEAEQICRYFVETHLKPKVCKGKPLAHWFVTHVVSSELFKKKTDVRNFCRHGGPTAPPVSVKDRKHSGQRRVEKPEHPYRCSCITLVNLRPMGFCKKNAQKQYKTITVLM